MLELIEILGTAAFAVSGAMVGIKKRLDLFGVFVIAILTASGGGLLRDIFLNKPVPVFFSDERFFITIVVSAGAVVIARNKLELIPKYTRVVLWFDAVGLGVFSVLSAYGAMQAGLPGIGVFFLGCLSGIGGSICRDVLVREIPVVLRKEIYAVACIAGIAVLMVFDGIIGHDGLVYLSVVVVVAVRMLSLRYGIQAPVIKK